MDNKETSYNLGGIGFLALFFLIIIAFWGRGGNAWGNGFGGGYDGVPGTGYGFQNFKATCDAEKAEIINSATTQYRVEQQAAQTRELVSSTASATQAKIDFYAYQDLRDRLSRAEMDNYFLKGQIANDARFGAVEKQLASIQCNMLRRPDVTGVGVACPSAAILNGLGVNSLNGWNNCGCNGNNSLV